MVRKRIPFHFFQNILGHNELLKYKWKVKVLVAQLCLTLCDPMDCSPPGSSVHGIFHTRILEWVAISFSRGRTHGSCTGERILYHWATWQAQCLLRPGLRCDATRSLWIPWVKANHQPSQIQGVGKLIQPLDGITCKVKLQRDVGRGKWTIHTISPNWP